MGGREAHLAVRGVVHVRGVGRLVDDEPVRLAPLVELVRPLQPVHAIRPAVADVLLVKVQRVGECDEGRSHGRRLYHAPPVLRVDVPN